MLHKEFSEAGEATRALAFAKTNIVNAQHMANITADTGMEWPISGDQLAALKADAKNREDRA